MRSTRPKARHAPNRSRTCEGGGISLCVRGERAQSAAIFLMVSQDMRVEVTILTLAFDPLLEGFPNERVRDFLVDREILSVDTFSFVDSEK